MIVLIVTSFNTSSYLLLNNGGLLPSFSINIRGEAQQSLNWHKNKELVTPKDSARETFIAGIKSIFWSTTSWCVTHS